MQKNGLLCYFHMYTYIHISYTYFSHIHIMYFAFIIHQCIFAIFTGVMIWHIYIHKIFFSFHTQSIWTHTMCFDIHTHARTHARMRTQCALLTPPSFPSHAANPSSSACTVFLHILFDPTRLTQRPSEGSVTEAEASSWWLHHWWNPPAFPAAINAGEPQEEEESLPYRPLLPSQQETDVRASVICIQMCSLFFLSQSVMSGIYLP